MTNSPQHENETTQQYVIRLMEEAVALKGEDYVYERAHDGNTITIGAGGCYYVRDGRPSCIVGHVLHAAGVPLDRLSQHEGASAFLVVRAEAPLEWEPFEDAFDKAQAVQDQGGTWGEALRAFKAALPAEEPTHYLAGEYPGWRP